MTMAQTSKYTLTWDVNTNVRINPEIAARQILTPFSCRECTEIIAEDFNLPIHRIKLNKPGYTLSSASIRVVKSDRVAYSKMHSELTASFDISIEKMQVRGKVNHFVNIVALRKSGSSTEMLQEFELIPNWIVSTQDFSSLKKKKDQTYTSVLSSGDFYKVAVFTDGVHRITPAFLAQSGINTENLSINSLKIYGNGGNMLPELIASERAEDLEENPLYIVDGNNNGIFDNDDYAMWYAVGPTKYEYRRTSKTYAVEGHDFDIAAYYFITWGNGAGKRVASVGAGQSLSATNVVSEYDFIAYHEANEENHIGSGRRWWGDKMIGSISNKTFDYTIPNTVIGKEGYLRTITTGRSTNGSDMRISVNGFTVATPSFGRITGKYDDEFAAPPVISNEEINITGSTFSINFEFRKTQNDAAAYIDYFSLTVPRRLQPHSADQIHRFGTQEVSGTTKFQFSELSTTHTVWNVTNPKSPALQQLFTEGANQSVTLPNITLEKPPVFAVFQPTATPLPGYIGKVVNQNLHGLRDIDYLIVTSPELMEPAQRLADFHLEYSGLRSVVVDKNEVFNEFSSGSQDVTAIRDLAKLLYDRSMANDSSFQYLLLFGDGSYDYKGIEENNENIAPIYQSYQSNDPTTSYCSDDYYAILEDNEGRWGTNGDNEGMDVNVGRIPATNITEANTIVNKIIHYHSEASRGNWIETLTFLADDEDDNSHVSPSESMTESILAESPFINIKKIWMDAYEQISFGSGNKFPAVNAEVTKMINTQGSLLFNYVGHGGENGMAHERVVTRPEIINWNNYDKLSFYVTASCELAKIDNLEVETPGELMLFDTDGGAIGLLATTRAVFIGTNTRLNSALVNNNLFKKDANNQYPTLGEAYRVMRERTTREGDNARCFILLADPAMRLLSPEHRITTTAINGTEIGLYNDTINALELITIEGEIRDYNTNQLMTDFNGDLYPTFYDKVAKNRTLGQDAESIAIDFTEQNRIIYKGKVSVIDGKFSFRFVVPKDIAYNIGPGKLSYYAQDGLKHAGGVETAYLIGGTSSNTIDDRKFDDLQLFMNDESWAFGGITDKSPRLIATLYDSSGINTIGSGIGREMEAIIDQGTPNEQIIILNDFYIPELNSYQQGRIEYPFEELEPGIHTLTLKVWDVYNNSAKEYTEFIVTEDEDVTLSNVLNYPNPFSNFTTFHFDHNKAGQNISAALNIYSVAGNIVKSIYLDIPNAPAHSADIVWDGKDNFGDDLARGVYLYKLSVKAEDGSTYTKTQKLYIVH